jgi:hypothetical protein
MPRRFAGGGVLDYRAIRRGLRGRRTGPPADEFLSFGRPGRRRRGRGVLCRTLPRWASLERTLGAHASLRTAAALRALRRTRLISVRRPGRGAPAAALLAPATDRRPLVAPNRLPQRWKVGMRTATAHRAS